MRQREMDCEEEGAQNAYNNKIKIGVCVMEKKAFSAPMEQILDRLQAFGEFEIIYFGDKVIIQDPVESWPICDCLIAFHSSGYPLEKAEAYAALRKPFVVNELAQQHLLHDRRKVYERLEMYGIPVPRYALVNRDTPNQEVDHFIEQEDFVEVQGKRFWKPFVEKPIHGDDHRIMIYYPSSAGGGMKELFRKVGNRSSEFHPEVRRVRREGSYIYEEFMPTGGTDVKVYTVGPEYAHAEARKSPVVDGVVMRNPDGKEVRYPVLLTPSEKQMARDVCIAFRQLVCGFDLLRCEGRSYVCDVNGWSFVKNSHKYYDDAACVLRKMFLDAKAPHLSSTIPPTLPWKVNEPVQPSEGLTRQGSGIIGTFGQAEELRCVIAIIRHGDRTPKQKVKLKVTEDKLLNLMLKYNGGRPRSETKLKSAVQLQDLLDATRMLVPRARSGRESDSDAEDLEHAEKLRQVKSVLEEDNVIETGEVAARICGSSSCSGAQITSESEASFTLNLYQDGCFIGKASEEVESRILKALQPQLCLGPTPMLDTLCRNPVTTKLTLGLCGPRKQKMPEVTIMSNNQIHGKKICSDGIQENSNCRSGIHESMNAQHVKNNNLPLRSEIFGPQLDNLHDMSSNNSSLLSHLDPRGLQYGSMRGQMYPQRVFEGVSDQDVTVSLFNSEHQEGKYAVKGKQTETFDKTEKDRSRKGSQLWEAETNHLDAKQSRLQQRFPQHLLMRSHFPQTRWHNLGQLVNNDPRKEDHIPKWKLAQSPQLSAVLVVQSPVSSRSGEFYGGSFWQHFNAVVTTTTFGSSQKEKGGGLSGVTDGGSSIVTSSPSDSMQRQHQGLVMKQKSNSLPINPAMSGVGSRASVSNMITQINANSTSVSISPVADLTIPGRFSKVETVAVRHQVNSKKNKVDDNLARKPMPCSTQVFASHLATTLNTEDLNNPTCTNPLSESPIGGSMNVCKTQILTFVHLERRLQGTVVSLVLKARDKLMMSEKQSDGTGVMQYSDVNDGDFSRVEKVSLLLVTWAPWVGTTETTSCNLPQTRFGWTSRLSFITSQSNGLREGHTAVLTGNPGIPRFDLIRLNVPLFLTSLWFVSGNMLSDLSCQFAVGGFVLDLICTILSIILFVDLWFSI